jgi:hypothetical protein
MSSESKALACPNPGVIPFGFRLATFEFVKLPTGKAFTIQNLKSKIQNPKWY